MEPDKIEDAYLRLVHEKPEVTESYGGLFRRFGALIMTGIVLFAIITRVALEVFR